MKPVLQELLKEIENLEHARKLLDKIWMDIGPYDQGKITDDTWRELRKFYDFDDSE